MTPDGTVLVRLIQRNGTVYHRPKRTGNREAARLRWRHTSRYPVTILRPEVVVEIPQLAAWGMRTRRVIPLVRPGEASPWPVRLRRGDTITLVTPTDGWFRVTE